MAEDGPPTCPNCGEQCDRESVDVGVGVIFGPWGCSCGWSEDPEYNQLEGGKGGVQPDGSYCDPYGNIYPAESLVAKMLRRAKDEQG